MDDFQNNEVDDVDGSPTRPAKLGVMLSSHIIVLPETCWIKLRGYKVSDFD